MSTAAAPVDTTGDSPTSAIDPIDALDFSSADDGVELTTGTELPASMVIGAEKSAVPSADDQAATDRGDGRTSDGKFARKPGEETPETAAPVPFQFRAMGKTHDLEGAAIDPVTGDLKIPAAKVADVQQAFNALELAKGSIIPALEHQKQETARLRGELESAKRATTLKDAQASSLVEFFTKIANEPNDETALAMMWELRGNFPKLLATAEAAHWKGEAERAAKAGRPASPPTESPAVPSTTATMPAADEVRALATEHIEQWKIHPNNRDIPADAWKHATEKATATPFAFLRTATADDAKNHPGVQVGETVFDRDLLLAEATTYRDQHAKQRETADAQARLAAQNATRSQPSISAPPTPGGGRAPIPKSKSPQTKAELESWFDSDTLD